MSTVGIIILLIASVIRGWGILNHRRGPMEAALIASGPILAILGILSIILGLVGAIFIGYETSFWVGLLVFVAFWFMSRIWTPIISSLGL